MYPLLHSLISSVAMVLVSASAVGCTPRAVNVQREAADPEAVADALAVVDRSPAHHASSRAYLHYTRGMLAMHQGDYASAESELRQALLHDRNSLAIRVALAEAELQSGEIDKAIRNIALVLEADPGSLPAIALIGLLVESGDWVDQAEELLRGALAGDPDNGHLVGSLGGLMLRMGRLSEALPKLELAARSVPDDPDILEHLGDARAQAGQSEEAREAYSRALAILEERWGTNGERELRLRKKIEELGASAPSEPASLLE